jgi:TolA-binding protein
MKKSLFFLLTLVFMASFAPAQESATQQQIDTLVGKLQDANDAIDRLDKRIAVLEKEIAELRDKVNTPAVNDYANRAELKALAEQVQEIDRNRKKDSDMIANQIDKLARAAATAPPPVIHPHPAPPKADDTPASSTPQKGYEYEVKQGDNLGLIIKAYRDKGVKVTLKQIEAANPTMNPNVLIPGKKIFIPDANAK